ncbi:MAG: polysaccharide biosynthesis tyrosine autokinase [Bacteroidetes bacterium]|nr:polysaccharide biosynthesis tyrosine autokinase [Bacteroidota bacterium]
MEQQQNQQFSDRIIKQINTSFDFKRLLGTLLSNWYWFVLFVSVTLTAGFLYLRYTTPIYQINSSLLIDENKDDAAQSVLSKLDPDNDKSQVNLFNEKVILQSHDLIYKVVDSLDLNIRFWALGRVKETEIYQECPIKIVFDTAGFKGGFLQLTVKQSTDGQFEITQNNVTEKVLYDTWVRKDYGHFKIVYNNGPGVNFGYLKSTEFIVKMENIDYAVERISGSFAVTLNDGRTSLLDLAYTDNISARGIDFMNALIYFYRKNELENINLKAEKTRRFLKEKQATMKNDMKVMDSAQVDIQQQNEILDPKAQASEFLTAKTEGEGLMNELIAEKEAVAALKANTLTNRRNQIIAGVSIKDANLLLLVGEYNQLIQKREQTARNSGPENPLLKEIDNEIYAKKVRIADACDKILDQLDMSLANAAKNVTELESKVKNTPTVERDLREANRGYEVIQSTFLILYQKEIENEISVNAATNKSKIVVVPRSSGAPISPVPRSIYGMMFLLGILIPGGFLVTREILNNKVINDHDIESLTNIPIVGTISRIESATNRENTIVVGPHIRTGVAEQFRLIRANLEFMASASNNRTFMITSSSSGEGKSFISINLGITMTLAKKRVVIMEFDLRKPKISQYLGLSNEGGISGYLAGMGGLETVLKASGIHENLYIANCGPVPPNPGELLVLPKTKQLFDELQEMFDIIIIDTAPIGLVSDALILSQYAGLNLFVVRQSYTVKDQVRMFDVLHKDGKIHNPGIIFNGVEFLKKYGYGYGGTGYGYSYGYGYGYGYYEDMSPATRNKKRGGLLGFFTK